MSVGLGVVVPWGRGVGVLVQWGRGLGVVGYGAVGILVQWGRGLGRRRCVVRGGRHIVQSGRGATG